MKNGITRANIPAASGHPLVTALQHPIYQTGFLERWRLPTQIDVISTMSDSGISHLGQTVYHKRPPVGQLFPYTDRNQNLEHSYWDQEYFTFGANYAWYWNLKLNVLDKEVDGIEAYITEFEKDAKERHKIQIMPMIVQEMVQHASPYNKGQNAGRINRSANLGTPSAPIVLNKDNFWTFLALMRDVMGQSGALVETMNDMFILAPNRIQLLFPQLEVMMDASQSGSSESYAMSGVRPNIFGMGNMVLSHYMPMYRAGDGSIYYPLVMGSKKATVYRSDIVMAKTEEHKFDTNYLGLILDGWGVMYPELLCVAMVKIDV